MSKFSERLHELRTENNLTTKQLGKLLDVSDATISRWENGINDIRTEQLIRVAKFFNVTSDFLIGLED